MIYKRGISGNVHLLHFVQFDKITKTKMMWVLAFVLIGTAAAQVSEIGDCPYVSVNPDFDVTKFVGKWYEAQRYFNLFELVGKCISVTYSANPNGTIGVVNSLISIATGEPLFIEGIAKQDENDKAKLTAVFPFGSIMAEAPYWVVGTDYDSFAVIWSCERISFFNFQFAWLLTREQQPTESALEKAYAVIDKNGIKRSLLRVTDQQNCS